jgi:hypothetical protein
MKAGRRRRRGISKAFQRRGRPILYRPTGERAKGSGIRHSARLPFTVLVSLSRSSFLMFADNNRNRSSIIRIRGLREGPPCVGANRMFRSGLLAPCFPSLCTNRHCAVAWRLPSRTLARTDRDGSRRRKRNDVHDRIKRLVFY